MSQLWPRVSLPVANAAFESMGSASVQQLAAKTTLHHSRETFAATGGSRVTGHLVGDLITAVRDTAAEFGYPEAGNDTQRIAFDRAAAEVLFGKMDITSVEAATRGIWSFLAIVALPDVTLWRFGRKNIERWVASDLTRHMFSRLWWQALTFAVDEGTRGYNFALLRGLSERDLNQITERRTIGGNTPLAKGLARMVAVDRQDGKKDVLREITPKLRRRLAFIDFSVLSEDQIDDQLRSLAR